MKDFYAPIGKESLDPVALIKIPLLQYLFGIPSMRRTIREIETDLAYRWYLGYGLREEIPHFSTFGKNYKRRFEGTDVFERIFQQVLETVMEQGFLHTEQLFVDGTHVKASANLHKSQKELLEVSARIIGMNKVCKTTEDAVVRARNYAAPVNVQRCSINPAFKSVENTPCVVDGSCGNCKSDDCICSYIVETRMCKTEGRIKIIF